MARSALKRHYSARKDKNVIMALDNLTEVGDTWNYWSGGGTISIVSDAGEGIDAIGIVRPAAEALSRVYIQPSPALDLSSYRGMGVRIRFPEVESSNDLLNLRINVYFQSSSGNLYNMAYGGGVIAGGWVYFGARWVDMVANGSPDNSAINQINIYVQNDAGDAEDLVLFSELVEHEGCRTTLCIIHDDANESDYLKAYPILNTAGLKGCSSVYTNNPSTDADYFPWPSAGGGVISQAQADEMYDSGNWEFLNHSRNGNTFSGQTESEVTTQITDCRDYLRANFPSGADHLIYPGGYYDQTVLTIAKSLDVKTGRVAGGIVPNERHQPANENGTSYLYTLGTVTIGENNSVTEIKASIDEGIAMGANLIIVYGHGVSDTAATPATALTIRTSDYQLIIDHIKLRVDQGLIDNKLYSEWYEALTTSGKRSAA